MHEEFMHCRKCGRKLTRRFVPMDANTYYECLWCKKIYMAMQQVIEIDRKKMRGLLKE